MDPRTEISDLRRMMSHQTNVLNDQIRDTKLSFYDLDEEFDFMFGMPRDDDYPNPALTRFDGALEQAIRTLTSLRERIVRYRTITRIIRERMDEVARSGRPPLVETQNFRFRPSQD